LGHLASQVLVSFWVGIQSFLDCGLGKVHFETTIDIFELDWVGSPVQQVGDLCW
jgi:hypothetical protein